MHTNRFLPIAALAAALAFAGTVQAAPSRYISPVAYSAACRADAARSSACALVRSFFRDLNSSRFVAACALLGERLRGESGGDECPAFLGAGASDPHPWGIVGARRAAGGVDVMVTLGQSELGHERMRLWRVAVRAKHAVQRIVATQLVR